MVNITDFKEEGKKKYLTVAIVSNAVDRTALITGEATIEDYKSKQGNPFKKLAIPVDFNGESYILGVYADIGQRIGLSFGLETRD